MQPEVVRSRAQDYFEALATRDPERIAPFLDENVDWLLVGPVELFPWCGHHFGKSAVIDVYRNMASNFTTAAYVREYLLVDGDCASSLTRVTLLQKGRWPVDQPAAGAVRSFPRRKGQRSVRHHGQPRRRRAVARTCAGLHRPADGPARTFSHREARSLIDPARQRRARVLLTAPIVAIMPRWGRKLPHPGKPLDYCASQYILLRCGTRWRRVTAALLGRFLPRLGPLAPASGPFLSLAPNRFRLHSARRARS